MHILIGFFLVSLLAVAEDYKVAGLDPFISQVNRALASQNIKETILHQDVRYHTNEGVVSSIYGTFQVGCGGGRGKKKLVMIFSDVVSKEIDVEKDIVAQGYDGLRLQASLGLLASDQRLQVDLLGFVIRRIRGACLEPEAEDDLYLKVRLWGKPGQPYQASGVKISKALFEGLK